MTELELFKLGHEAKDVVDMADITFYMNELAKIVQHGKWSDVDPIIDKIIDKYKTEVNQYNEGRTPARTPQEKASSCYNFLAGLRSKKMARKGAEKLTEETLKHLGGN